MLTLVGREHSITVVADNKLRCQSVQRLALQWPNEIHLPVLQLGCKHHSRTALLQAEWLVGFFLVVGFGIAQFPCVVWSIAFVLWGQGVVETF